MVDEFVRLQSGLAEVWPALTLRSREATARTNIVVHSLSKNPPAQLAPVLPAYEERFLCLVLGLLRTPGSRVVYVTSQPVLPRVVCVPRLGSGRVNQAGPQTPTFGTGP